MLSPKPNIDTFTERSTKVDYSPDLPEGWLTYCNKLMLPLNQHKKDLMYKSCENFKNKLDKTYQQLNLSIDFLIIGGLLNNTCINSSQSIDLLIINNGFYRQSAYTNNEKVFLQELIALRNFTKKHLKSSYPEAKIDDSRPLSIDFKLQSLPYTINLFFGLWHYGSASKSSGYFSDNKSVNLLNYNTYNYININPNKTLANLDNKDINTNGNMRRLIRLLKNLKEQSAHKKHLSGLKIESIVYAMKTESLNKYDQTTTLLIECSLYLKNLVEDPLSKNYIISADGKFIFDQGNSEDDIEEILNLKSELNKLLKRVILNTH